MTLHTLCRICIGGEHRYGDTGQAPKAQARYKFLIHTYSQVIKPTFASFAAGFTDVGRDYI
jgi:hypothetical protein